MTRSLQVHRVLTGCTHLTPVQHHAHTCKLLPTRSMRLTQSYPSFSWLGQFLVQGRLGLHLEASAHPIFIAPENRPRKGAEGGFHLLTGS